MSKQGKGTADHILPLGDWLTNKVNVLYQAPIAHSAFTQPDDLTSNILPFIFMFSWNTDVDQV